MEFARILNTLMPVATRAVIETPEATVEITMTPKSQEAPLESLSERKTKTRRTSSERVITQAAILDLVGRAGAGGCRAKDLIEAGISAETPYSDLAALVKAAKIQKHGVLYYSV